MNFFFRRVSLQEKEELSGFVFFFFIRKFERAVNNKFPLRFDRLRLNLGFEELK